MKKIAVVLVLTLAGLTFAQSNIYAGASIGVGAFSGLGAIFPVSGHVGFEDVYTDNLDTRIDLTFVLGGGTGFELGANGIYNFSVSQDLPLEIYIGGGGRFIFVSDIAIFGGGALVGTDYHLGEQLSLFGEGRFDTYFSGLITRFGVGVGAKFHF